MTLWNLECALSLKHFDHTHLKHRLSEYKGVYGECFIFLREMNNL